MRILIVSESYHHQNYYEGVVSNQLTVIHMLNMELGLHSLFGLLCTAVLIG
jgi:hypothetical protein